MKNIEFVGMRQLKELGTIQSIYTNHASDNQLVGTYAIGFTSADFVIWDLGNDAKVQNKPISWKFEPGNSLANLLNFEIFAL